MGAELLALRPLGIEAVEDRLQLVRGNARPLDRDDDTISIAGRRAGLRA